ncbi:MAG TPA: YiiX/YebB-like N1pC/P60 family cysteine hydrolase [Bacteroidia bacterium]|nr:YiiX/YebB-like N1pC/P60 family cysteine hydrolase [Bacteroidia bacterium]
MKQVILFSLFTFFIFSCGEDKKNEKADSLRMDSALKALTSNDTVKPANALPSTTANTDTTHTIALPPVVEGDIIFQTMGDEQSMAFGKATHSKYNNVGLVFIRPRDNLYVVMECRDSLHATPLTEWVNRGQGHHVALMRLKDSNTALNEKKTNHLKMAAKPLKGKKTDLYFSWSDDAFYCSELVWKLYKQGTGIELCTPGKMSQLDLNGALVKQQMKNKYGATIPMDEQVVTPDDLYNSPKLVKIYEH